MEIEMENISNISGMIKTTKFLCENAPSLSIILFHKTDNFHFFIQKKKNGWAYPYINPALLESPHDYDVSDSVLQLIPMLAVYGIKCPKKLPMLESVQEIVRKVKNICV